MNYGNWKVNNKNNWNILVYKTYSKLVHSTIVLNNGYVFIKITKKLQKLGLLAKKKYLLT